MEPKEFRMQKRLSILKAIAKAKGIEWPELFTMNGVARQMSSYYWNKDDMKLKYAINIMKSIGIKLGVDYTDNEKESETVTVPKIQTENPDSSVYITGDFLSEIQKIKDTELITIQKEPKTGLSKKIFQTKDSDATMAFLARYIYNNYRSRLLTFIEDASISYVILDNIFENDDISFKNLYKIADSLNLNVVWSVNKI